MNLVEFLKKMLFAEQSPPKASVGKAAVSTAQQTADNAGATLPDVGDGNIGINIDDNAEAINIKYGQSEIKLTKNKRYVAVKKAKAPSNTETELKDKRLQNTRESIGPYQIYENMDPDSGSVDLIIEDIMQDDLVDDTQAIYTMNNEESVNTIPTGEIYIVFSSDTTTGEIEHIMNQFSLEVLNKYDELTYLVKTKRNPILITKDLQLLDCIKNAEPELLNTIK